jgi:hypothetical protein
MSAGKIRWFIEHFGLCGLLGTKGTAALDTGLKYPKLSESEMLSRIERDPQLLRLPLIRAGKSLSGGPMRNRGKRCLRSHGWHNSSQPDRNDLNLPREESRSLFPVTSSCTDSHVGLRRV